VRALNFYPDNRMHGSMWRREETGTSRASTSRAEPGASRRPDHSLPALEAPDGGTTIGAGYSVVGQDVRVASGVSMNPGATLGDVLGTVVFVALTGGALIMMFRRAGAEGLVWPVAVGFGLRLAVMLVAHALSAGEHGLLFLDDQTMFRYGVRIASAWRAAHLINPAAYNYAASYEFGYPVLVGAVFTLVGPHVLAVKLVDVVLGTATVLMVGMLARRFVGARATLPATWIAALMPTLVWWSAPMLKECLATFLCTAAVLAVSSRPSRRAGWLSVAAGISLFFTRSASAGAVAFGVLVGSIACAVQQRSEMRWRAIGGTVALVLIGAATVLFAVTGGRPGALVVAYHSTAERMFRLYQGHIASVPGDAVKTLVTPLPWAFGAETRDWDRGLYPGVWAWFFLYPTVARGLWRLRARPDALTLGGFIAVLLIVNAATSGYAFRQRSVLEPILLVLAVAGMKSWRQLFAWGAGGVAVAAVVAGVNTRSPVTAGVIVASAAVLLAVSRRLPSTTLWEALPESPTLRFVQSLAGSRSRWVAHDGGPPA
jgi:hypothetical protein